MSPGFVVFCFCFSPCLPVQLIPLPAARHRPVALHYPRFLPAQPFSQSLRHVLRRSHSAGRFIPELPVVLRPIRLGQKCIRRRQILDPRQPQRFDQPVWQHAVHPFPPPFGLRAVRQDRFHAQRLQRPSKLGLRFFPGDLLGDAPQPFAPVEAVPIHLQTLRQAIPPPPAR